MDLVICDLVIRINVSKIVTLIPNFITRMRQIKLIWDFRGLAAAKTAEHHEIHLKEYIVIEKLPLNITGFEIKNDVHAIAFMVVNDEHMIQVRDTLKPHRGEIYTE